MVWHRHDGGGRRHLPIVPKLTTGFELRNPVFVNRLRLCSSPPRQFRLDSWTDPTRTQTCRKALAAQEKSRSTFSPNGPVFEEQSGRQDGY